MSSATSLRGINLDRRPSRDAQKARAVLYRTSSLQHEEKMRRELEPSGEPSSSMELERGKTFFIDSPMLAENDSALQTPANADTRKPSHRKRLSTESKVGKSLISILNVEVLQGNFEQVKNLVTSGGVNGADEYGKTPLHRAAEKQNVQMTEFFIDQGANVNALDNREETPLHTAVRTGNESIVEVILLSRRVEVNAHGENSKTTPLHLATQLEQNNAAICKMLLVHEADLFAKDSNGTIPIVYAAQKGFSDVMECFFQHASSADVGKLLSNVDNRGSTLMHYAVASKHIEAVKLCIQHGAQVHEKRTSDGTTAVHIACTHGPFEVLELMLRDTSFIYDYALTDNDGQTCLHRAAKYNQAQTIDFLHSQDINIDPREKSGKTPLMLGVARGCKEAVKVLLDKDADVTVQDDKRRTVVHFAIGHPETLALLLKYDKIHALVQMKDKAGCTALHYAAGKGHAQEVELLVKYRKYLSTKKNDNGDTPLHLAASNGWLEIVQILLEGDNPTMMNVLDDNERTPMHLAAFGAHVGIVAYLLLRGASIQKDRDEQTPLHVAASKGSLDTVKVLLRTSFTYLNALDKKKQNALHLATCAGHAQIVDYLLSIKEQDVKMVAPDEQNVLDLAIEHHRVHVAMTLAEHKRWREVFRPQSHGSLSQMELLVEKMPEVAERFLDRCIRKEGDIDSSQHKIIYDLRFLQGMTDEDDHNSKPQNSLKAIYAMVKHKRLGCLHHPTTVALINLKWRKYGLMLVLVHQILSFLYLISVICLVITLEVNPCFRRETCNSTTRQEGPIDWPKRPKLKEYNVLKWVLLGLSGFKILKQLWHIHNMGWRYIKEFGYVMELTLGIAMFVFLAPEGCEACYGAGAVAACMAWFSLIFRLSEVTFLGIYVMMMGKIFETVSKVFLLLFMFILCFGFSFYVLNFQQKLFKSLSQSLVTTFVMMLGEMNYSEIFLDDSEPMQHPHIMYPLYILFCFCMPIIFLNFLIGLAVGDIESIQKDAALQRHSVQVRQLHTIEDSFPSFCLKRWEVKDDYIEYPTPGRTKPLRTVLFDVFVGTMATMMGKNREEQGNGVEDVIKRQNDRLKNITRLVEFQNTQLQHLRGLLGIMEESLKSPDVPHKKERLQSLKSRAFNQPTVSNC